MYKEPLSPQELCDMAGKPVYCPKIKCYGIIKYETIGRWAGIPFLVGVWHNEGVAVDFEYDIVKGKLKCYKIIINSI